MKTNSNAATRNSSDPNHPALARDAQGNPIPMPDGTAAWLLKRDTGGRPRTIIASNDRQPARFQLDTTPDDIEAMFGPGTYRVYAITDLGEMIDYVTTVVVGESGAKEETTSGTVRGESRAPSSDLRFALETILQMARAQSESLRAVAEAQADWVKGLATAKALPRNAAPAPLPPPVPAANDDDEDDEDDEDGEEEDSGSELAPWMEMINTIAPALQTYGEVLKLKFAPPAPTRNVSSAEASGPNPMVHLSEINARLTPVERKFLNLVLRSKGGDETTAFLLRRSVDDAVAFVKEQVACAQAERRKPDEVAQPPAVPEGDFIARVVAASALLTAEERAAVLGLMPKFPAARLEELKAKLVAMPPQDAAAWIRENLDALRAEVAS